MRPGFAPEDSGREFLSPGERRRYKAIRQIKNWSSSIALPPGLLREGKRSCLCSSLTCRRRLPRAIFCLAADKGGFAYEPFYLEGFLYGQILCRRASGVSPET